MAETQRELSTLLTNLADNAVGNISAEDLRDSVISTFDCYAAISMSSGASTGDDLDDVGTWAGTPTKVSVFDTNLQTTAGVITADQANNKLTVALGGTYLIFWSISFSGSTDVFEGRVYVNGTALSNQGRWVRKIGTGGDQGNACCMAIATIAASQDIEVYVAADSAIADIQPVLETVLAAVKIG